MSNAPTLLTTNEVAIRLGVHRRMVERLVRSGDLPCVRIGPRSLRFSATDIDAFIASRKTEVAS